ncbi:MAG: response regulator [Nannocystis sp.]|nr:ATP-binding protein [Nannocystis sp.]MBA3546799.1 response regulator [Nannocystis sp.]
MTAPSRHLAGEGEMGKLIRSMDWSTSPLGPIDSWPHSLRTAVSLCLASTFPINLIWGPKHVQMYNDGYWPLCGTKHPHAMGQDYTECWASAWPVIGDAFARALTGESTFLENQRMFLDRKGFLEETFFTFSFSPIRDETGGIGGLFHPVTEVTSKMLSERRTRALRDLALRTAKARSVREVFVVAAQSLQEHDLDVPFALVYALDADGSRATLAALVGLASGSAAAPEAIDVDREAAQGWPLAEALRAGGPLHVQELERRHGRLVAGPYPEAPSAAVLVPITPAGCERARAVIVFGVSSRLELDDPYAAFFELVAAAITAAIASASAYEDQHRRVEALAALDRAKTAFFSNVSHEFRTPLTLMLGPVEDLLAGAHGELAGAQQEQLRMIRRSSLRLQKLVNALLDFARIEAGRLQASYEPVDLAALTRDLASAFRSAVERAGLEFVVDCLPVGDVHVDRDMWEKIVFNLLSNALKFTFEGRIEVALRPAPHGVSLRVCDTGVGIPPEHVPRLFERFHRVQGTRARSEEGSGIGLALVHELAKLHGGSVEAHTEVDRGTTFTVTVPTRPGPMPEERSAAPRPMAPTSLDAAPFVEEALQWVSDAVAGRSASGASAAHSDPNGRILVADDNADMRSYLRRILEPHWEVEVVNDGARALAAARARPPDLLLTDVMMPGLDGFALVRALREDDRTRAIPIVMLSARAGDEARAEGVEAGVEDYLVKPFSTRELLARVRTHLELGRLRDGLRSEREDLYGLFMQAPAAICVFKGDGLVFEMANERYLEVVGRTRSIVGRPLLDVMPELRGQGFAEILHGVMSSGEPFVGEERPIRMDIAGDGTVEDTWWTFVYAPLQDARGVCDRVMALVENVTERVQERRTRDNQIAALERTVRFSEMFVGVLGHDLRNPLSAITTAAAVLKHRAESEAIAKPVARIVTSSQRMARMIDQLLDFALIRLGRGIPIRRLPLDLAALARAAVDELEAVHRCSIGFEAIGDLHGEWDGDRLSQLLSNLVGNACQHRRPGSDVLVRVRGAEDVTLVEVCNEGAIPPSLLPGLFEPLGVAPAKRQGGSSGLGLGLYISQQVAAAHGGSIQVRSAEATGTRFLVELPRRGGDVPRS